MAEDPVLLWRLADPARTRIARFDGEALVFNPVSWETHLVRPLVSWLLEALEKAPTSDVQLAARLARTEDDAEDPEAALAEIRTVLKELEELGLVRSAPATS